MRKFLCAVCSLTLLFSVSTNVFAAGTETQASENEVAADESQLPAPELGIMLGEITGEKDGQVTVQNPEDEDDVIVLNITTETGIVDSETGLSAELSDRDNDLVKVYYGPVMTMSLPPISNAVVIAINGQEGIFTPTYTIVEKVAIDGDSAEITADNGSVSITVNADSEIMPYRAQNRSNATVSDIKEGSVLLLWDEMIDAGTVPAQLAASRVVILGLSAENETEDEPEVSSGEDEASASPALEAEIIIGRITGEQEGQITVQDPESEDYTVVLNITPETVMVDSETGFSAELADRDNDLVKAYYGPVMTRSQPPISNAVIIAVNRQDGVFKPNYTVVEEIAIDGDSAEITADNGSSVITVNNDAEIISYLTQDAADISDIEEGSMLLLWDEMVDAESFPAQLTSTRVVILDSQDEAVASTEGEELAVSAEDEISGETREYVVTPMPFSLTTAPSSINGVLMHDVWAEFEVDGYTVVWDNAVQCAYISSAGKEMIISPGQLSATVNDTAVLLDHAPIIINNTLYAPADLIKSFLLAR